MSFSAVSKWNDTPGLPTREESRSNMKHKDRDSKMADALTAESSSVLDGEVQYPCSEMKVSTSKMTG